MPPTPNDQLSVLVIEDDDNILQLLRFMLARERYRVVAVSEGLSARKMIENEPPPSLVLSDVMLPFVDGFTLVALIRASAAWRNVPVIMLTAKTQEQDVVRALDAGANDYIHKPFAPNELLARVRRYARSPS